MPSRFSCVWLCAIVWTVASQAFLSMRFSRQEYWSGLTSPPSGDLPNPRLLCLLHSQADLLPLAPPRKPWCKNSLVGRGHLGWPLVRLCSTCQSLVVLLLYIHNPNDNGRKNRKWRSSMQKELCHRLYVSQQFLACRIDGWHRRCLGFFVLLCLTVFFSLQIIFLIKADSLIRWL